MASRELRATRGAEEVGSLERVCARFAPNFGPGPGTKAGASAWNVNTFLAWSNGESQPLFSQVRGHFSRLSVHYVPGSPCGSGGKSTDPFLDQGPPSSARS